MSNGNGSTPLTRTLAPVLRRALQTDPVQAQLRIATTGAATTGPDANAYANVIIDGDTVKVPRLAGAVAIPGAPAYILVIRDFILYLGTVSRTVAPGGGGGAPGPQGPAGTPGEKWFSGAGAPSGATGIIGDWWLDTAAGDVYEKTGASTWTLRGNLKGPQGPQGPAGSPPYVTSLPGSPVDGYEVYYRFQQNTNPPSGTWKFWHLKWFAFANVWVPVNDASAIVTYDATERVQATPAGSWGHLGPVLWAQAPVAGLYAIDFGVDRFWSSVTANWYIGAYDGLAWPSTAAPVNGLHCAVPSGPGGTWSTAHSSPKPHALLPLALCYWGMFLNAAGTVTGQNRWLRLRPLYINAGG